MDEWIWVIIGLLVILLVQLSATIDKTSAEYIGEIAFSSRGLKREFLFDPSMRNSSRMLLVKRSLAPCGRRNKSGKRGQAPRLQNIINDSELIPRCLWRRGS